MDYIGITKFEKARVIGARATQIANGAKITIKPVKNGKKLIHALELAEEEFNQGTIPITIVRTLPNGKKVMIDLVPS